MPIETTPVFWDQLLLLIEEGQVVPVVGPGLLTVQRNGASIPLQRHVSERLAGYLGVPDSDLVPGDELNTVACRYLSENPGNRQLLYSALKTILSRDDELGLPSTLVQLAEIRAFRLFISTTFDPLLERALNEVRYGGEPRTEVLAYAPDEREDITMARLREGPAIVYHLFGKLSARPAYVVTQEDTLEFMHSLQSELRQPEVLFDTLDRSNLLVLGSNLGGWLARFFVRMPKRQRLHRSRDTTDYLVDARLKDDPGLISFLKDLTTGIAVLADTDPEEFVEELHARWIARHPNGESTPGDRTRPSRPETAGAVFLSYASDDGEHALRVKNVLEESMEVFFDKEDLHSGEDWEAKIRRSIRSASVFVPLISTNTLASGRRHFRAEWAEAIEEAKKEVPTEPFIHPLVIDDVAIDHPALPERFATGQATQLVDGQVPPRFIADLLKIYKSQQWK